MYIGEVSKITGLSIKAIRLYEKKGLIPTPERIGRFRIYNDSYIDRLMFIKDAKTLGVTLAQLKEVLHLDRKGAEDFLIKKKYELKEEIKLLNKKISKIEKCLNGLKQDPENYLT
jgi:MerR family transcriptional regulator, copper efflux regulator